MDHAQIYDASSKINEWETNHNEEKSADILQTCCELSSDLHGSFFSSHVAKLLEDFTFIQQSIQQVFISSINAMHLRL